MLRIRIGKDLRDRYGCDEWLGFDFRRLNPVEAAVIQQRTGRTPSELLRELGRGVELRDPAGGPLLDAGGKPRMGTSWLAWTAAMWVVLRRNGHEVSWADVEANFNVFEFDWQYEADDDASSDLDASDVDSGKGESTPPTTSPPTSSGTSRRSRGGSTSARGRSKS